MKNNKIKIIKTYITLIVSLICLTAAIIMLLQNKTLDAVLYTQFATILYIMHKDTE